nr:E3 ubiquitin-protein ligase MARCH9 [Aotus nancymaae]
MAPPRPPGRQPLGSASPRAPAVAAVNGGRRPQRPQPGLALQRAPPSRPCPLPSPRRQRAPLHAAPRPRRPDDAQVSAPHVPERAEAAGADGRGAAPGRAASPRGRGRRLRLGALRRLLHPGRRRRRGGVLRSSRGPGLAGDKEPRAGPLPPPAPPLPPPGALDALSLSSSLDSGLRTPQCRICFQGPEQGELLSPCRCDGSVRCTHQPCLIRWISERGSWSCELCYFKYQVLAISTKNPLQWQAISLTVIEKVQIAAIVLGSLFLVASISWLIWSSLSPSAKWQRQDLLFQICYGMYGFMDVVCIGLIVHEGSSVYRIFKRWQAVNQQWKVLNYDKTKDIGGDAGGGTAGKPGPRTSRTGPPSGATSRPPTAQRMRTLLPQRCGYTILHLLGQLRPPDARSSSHSGREVVMRVTTV